MTPAPRRITVIALAVIGVLAGNLLLYAVGRAWGGTFTYTQNGKVIRVDAASVAIMSVIPLVIGLAAVAGLARFWPASVSVARIVAPTLAIATIGVMTIPAHFDTTSTLFLSAMHVTLAAAAVLAIQELPRRVTLVKQAVT